MDRLARAERLRAANSNRLLPIQISRQDLQLILTGRNMVFGGLA